MKCRKHRDLISKVLRRLLPASWIENWIARLTLLMGKSGASPRETVRKRAEDFFLTQIILVCVIAAAAAGLALGLKIRENMQGEEIQFVRNDFGEGDRKISVILKEEKKGGRRENYDFTLSEVRLSRRKKKEYAGRFFFTLSRRMLGDNKDWSAVSRPLDFPEQIPGYPFEISYKVKDPDYIYLDGSLSPRLEDLPSEESFSTEILVTAVYGDWTLERTWKVRLLSPKVTREADPFRQLKEYLYHANIRSGDKKKITLSGRFGRYSFCEEQSSMNPGTAFLAVLLPGILIPGLRFWKVYHLADLTQKQAERDFPSIVHRLTLYIGSGLSFMSAVDRISRDYSRQKENKGERYAYEKILIMDRQMKAGVSQTQACRRWGNQFRGTSYQKLALILVQSFTRGSREARTMMDKEEAEAFRLNVERARKEGEEASTKLLFPMIILLGEVTLLVMLPAILQFGSF